jgi:NodT family efflux transporter outer membrane factor (OMF) lipoprotein
MRAVPEACFVATVLLVAGCTAPPRLSDGAPESLALTGSYKAPVPPVPEVADGLLDLFDNAQLNTVVKRALAGNPDLRSSLARLEEAGFNMRKARGPLYPSLDGVFSASRGDGPGRRESSLFDAGLDARWEVDVWGRIRAGVEASVADEAAAAAGYEAARQSIAAQTMQAWFDLSAAEQLLDLATRRLASFENTKRSVSRRRDAGTASLADLELTRSDTHAAAAELEARRDERDRFARRLQALVGAYPGGDYSTSGPLPTLRRGVPAGLPSDLLRQRPEIDAAYQRIRGADARVQVAHADLFPSFTLTGSVGQSSNVLGDLARSEFTSWSVLAGLGAPLFDGGRRRAELGAAGKRAERAYQDYRGVVLNALGEVEDALGSERYLRAREAARQRSFASAREAEARTRRDYEAGITELLNLLITQRQVFSSEEQTINLRAARLKNRVALALALGKGT